MSTQVENKVERIKKNREERVNNPNWPTDSELKKAGQLQMESAIDNVKQPEGFRPYEDNIHDIKISNLMPNIEPFNCWVDIQRPLKEEDIFSAVENNLGQLTDTEYKWNESKDSEEAYWNHIKKVAYFIQHDIEKPISIDVGVPSLGFCPAYIVEDGNHRLLATIIKGNTTIKAEVSGSVDYAEELGLWNPVK